MSINSVTNDLATSVSFINAQKPLPPTISGYSVAGKDDTALDPAGGQTVQINGTGFLPGTTITFDGSAVAIVTYVSPNQLTFTSPAKSAGTYTIYVVNADGGTAIYIPGIIYSVLPTWTTAAGSLGSYYETQSIANTVVASGDAPITYSLFSGSLPTGSTLSANGVITGTAPVDSSSTTYSFTIQASDAQLQDSTRSFSLTINVDAVTWVSPANNTTYTSTANSAISTVTLSATDAAGYAVSYSANALPTGLSLSGANISGTPTVVADSSTLLTATAATTNRTAVRTINWSITVANDVYFEYNTLLIPGASTTFVDDASTNNFAVSIFGDTKPNNFNPYTPGYYSNYFDGSGDYLSVPSNAAFDLGAGDFTIEFWFNSQSFATAYGFISRYNYAAGTGSGWGLRVINSTTLRFIYGNEIVNDVTVSLNTISWYHLAVSRSGTTAKLFLNGTQVGSFTVNNFSDASSALQIGRTNTLTDDAYAYISNVRIVKGTAVYTSAFTPSTTPLTAISGTSLLTCQSNRFIDNSTNNFTITVNGNTTVNSFDPFVPNSSYSTYGSGYFDGTEDYLSVPYSAGGQLGSNNFTIEFWAYFSSVASGQQLLSAYQSGSTQNYALYTASNGTLNYYLSSTGSAWNIASGVSFGNISVNTWIHVALVRSGSTFTPYLNGVAGTTTTSASAIYTNTAPTFIGAVVNPTLNSPFTGYISDLRIVNGTAVYTTAFTPPASPLTAIANTQLLTLQNNQSVNNNVFLDNSTNNFFVTRNGNTTQGTFSPYGGNWSNYFDGTGDYLQTTGSSALTLDGNFTIEAWVYQTASNTYASIVASASATWTAGATNFFVLGSGNVPHLSTNPAGAGQIINGGTIVNNTWNHIAVSRSGTTASMWVNGTRVANVTLNATFNLNHNSGTKLGGGTWDGSGGNFFGYISNVRVIKGTDIYGISNTSITVPTTPLTPITNTSLLTCADSRFIDDSINNFTFTKNGDTSVQRFSPFNPSSLTPTSYSGYFDGTGDYLTAPSNTAFQFGTGDFTLETWVNLNNLGGYNMIFENGGATSGDTSGFSFGVTVTTGKLYVYTNGTFALTCSTTLAINTWYHVALVRNSGVHTVYLNGVSDGSFSTVYNYTGTGVTGQGVLIGKNAAGGEFYRGYLSNYRVVKGTAVYTGTFTPPTSPLTAISGTSLLTLQSTTFIDNSTNNFTITAVGNSQPTIQNPFGYTSATTNGYTPSTIGGSAYFDGTGDYLSVPSNATFGFGTRNYTIEGWVYLPSTSAYNQMIVDFRNATPVTGQPVIYLNTSRQPVFYIEGSGNLISSSSALALGTWNHIAVSKVSGTYIMYVNGTSVGTAANAVSVPTSVITIGADYSGVASFLIGYVSDIRVITGTALYTSNFVPPSAPLTAVQNTVLLNNMTSAGIYDAAMMNNMETIGDAKLSTAVSKFGGSSMSFDGTGDYMVGGAFSNPIHSIGSGDFTIEMWLYTNANKAQILIDTGTVGGSTTGIQCALNASGYPNTVLNNSIVLTSSILVSTTTWTHVAWVRSSGTLVIYVNGVSGGSVANSINISDTGLTIGTPNDYRDGSSTYHYNGYIDDLRITRGYARYTSNFTPPTTAFPIY